MAVPDSFPVLFTSYDAGAPSLAGAAATLRDVLRAALVSGSNVNAVTQIVVLSEVAVATSPAHGYSGHIGKLVSIVGASAPGLNGRVQPLAVSTNTFTYAAPGVADGTYTGSVTAKRVSAGWNEIYTLGSVSVFQSAALDALGLCLRVDDSGTTSARVVGYESMSGVSTGVGPFPTAAQQSGGLYWPKANNASGSRPWAVVADARSFYLYLQPTVGNPAGSVLGFGDALLGGGITDPWAGFLAGHATEVFTGGAGCLSAVSSAVAATLSLPRASSGMGSAVSARLWSALRTSGVSGSPTGSVAPTYPNAAHGELLLSAPWVFSDNGLRCSLPGLMHSPQGLVGMPPFDTEIAPGYMPFTTNPGASGVVLANVGGAWR